jgi:hypothetical protein
MGLIDKALWDTRHADPAAIEAELRGTKLEEFVLSD